MSLSSDTRLFVPHDPSMYCSEKVRYYHLIVIALILHLLFNPFCLFFVELFFALNGSYCADVPPRNS